MTRYGLPNCVGAVDGSLIPIVAPNKKKFNQNAYFSRKMFYAINALGWFNLLAVFLQYFNNRLL
jgi:hypothetical protein